MSPIGNTSPKLSAIARAASLGKRSADLEMLLAVLLKRCIAAQVKLLIVNGFDALGCG